MSGGKDLGRFIEKETERGLKTKLDKVEGH